MQARSPGDPPGAAPAKAAEVPGVSSEAPAGPARSWPGGEGQRGPPCAARTCRRWRERRPLCPLPSRGRTLRIFEVSLHSVVLSLMSESRLPESDSLPLARLGLGPHPPPRARARGGLVPLDLGAHGPDVPSCQGFPPATPVPAPPLRVGAPAVPEHASCGTQPLPCLPAEPTSPSVAFRDGTKFPET